MAYTSSYGVKCNQNQQCNYTYPYPNQNSFFSNNYNQNCYNNPSTKSIL